MAFMDDPWFLQCHMIILNVIDVLTDGDEMP